MKVLAFCLDYLTFLGVCSDRLYDDTNEFLKTINAWVFLFGFFGPLLSFSAAFILKNFADLEQSTNAMIVLTAGFASFGGWLAIGLKMKEVKLLYREIQAVVDAGMLCVERVRFANLQFPILCQAFDFCVVCSPTYAII